MKAQDVVSQQYYTLACSPPEMVWSFASNDENLNSWRGIRHEQSSTCKASAGWQESGLEPWSTAQPIVNRAEKKPSAYLLEQTSEPSRITRKLPAKGRGQKEWWQQFPNVGAVPSPPSPIDASPSCVQKAGEDDLQAKEGGRKVEARDAMRPAAARRAADKVHGARRQVIARGQKLADWMAKQASLNSCLLSARTSRRKSYCVTWFSWGVVCQQSCCSLLAL